MERKRKRGVGGVGVGSISKVHGRLHSETQDVGQSIFFF